MADSKKYKFGNLHLNNAKEVSDYTAKVVEEAEHLITHTIPDKIFSLKKMNEDEFSPLENSDLSCDLNVPHDGLRHQIDYSVDAAVSATDRLLNDGLLNDGLLHAGKKRKLDADGFPNSKTTIIPTNEKLVKLIDFVKPEILHIIEACEKVQMWIQLLIPRIEDGNNFGVSIQEEVLGEVFRVQSECTAYLDHISRYYITRASLATKVAKYPFVEDYRRAVKEIDDKQYMLMRISLNQIRNHYLLILDVVSKNYEKIKTPRSQNTGNMY